MRDRPRRLGIPKDTERSDDCGKIIESAVNGKEKDIEAIRSNYRFPAAKTMLATVDAFCAKQDLTRSQVFRRGIMEYLKTQNVPMTADMNPPEPQRSWPTELFKR
jgi:hypothetical protein